jgi:hypothetical protein
MSPKHFSPSLGHTPAKAYPPRSVPIGTLLAAPLLPTLLERCEPVLPGQRFSFSQTVNLFCSTLISRWSNPDSIEMHRALAIASYSTSTPGYTLGNFFHSPGNCSDQEHRWITF